MNSDQEPTGTDPTASRTGGTFAKAPHPTQHTFRIPDPSRRLHPDVIGTLVAWERKTYPLLGTYFAAGPEGQDHTLHQYWIGEEVNPHDVPRS